MRFLPHPQHKKDSDSDKMWTTHVKIAQNMYIFYPQISHLSSNRREQNLALYFQFMTPARKLTHTTKFEHFWMQKDTNFWEHQDSLALWARETPKSAPERHKFGNAIILRHFGPEKCQNQPQKYTNFGNAIILCYLEPENHQMQPRKTRILGNCTH